MNTNDNRLKAHKLIDHIFQDLLPAHGMAQRPEQIQLSHRMLDAMQDGRIALCDAGTGIGKTYAYLAAATAASAFPTGQIARPIIISTSSIALQNAVLTEYLPLLSCVLMADGILTKPLKAVIRKGKSHYVCDERLDRRRRSGLFGKRWTWTEFLISAAMTGSVSAYRRSATASRGTADISGSSRPATKINFCFKSAIIICWWQTPSTAARENAPSSRSTASSSWMKPISSRKPHNRCWV